MAISDTVSTFSQEIAAYLEGKRIMLDVSVLLTAMLVDDSDSAFLLAHTRGATIILSRHIEERAIAVLRNHAPQHLGAFGERLVRLGATATLSALSEVT